MKPKEQPAFNLGLEGEEKPKAPPPLTLEGEKLDCIEELVGALFDPIIAWPGPWMDTIPEAQKKRLPLERLVHLMRCQKGDASWNEATDLEALLYMYPLTMERPLSEQWTRIYLYLGTRVLQMPEDIKQETLTDYDMGALRDLKRWIYRKRVEARKERARAAKDKAPAAAEPEVAQARFF